LADSDEVCFVFCTLFVKPQNNILINHLDQAKRFTGKILYSPCCYLQILLQENVEGEQEVEILDEVDDEEDPEENLDQEENEEEREAASQDEDFTEVSL